MKNKIFHVFSSKTNHLYGLKSLVLLSLNADIIQKPSYAHSTIVLTTSHYPHFLASTLHKFSKYMIYLDLSTTSVTKKKLTTKIKKNFYFSYSELHISLFQKLSLWHHPCSSLLFHTLAILLSFITQPPIISFLQNFFNCFINVALFSTISNSPKNNDKICITHK